MQHYKSPVAETYPSIEQNRDLSPISPKTGYGSSLRGSVLIIAGFCIGIGLYYVTHKIKK